MSWAAAALAAAPIVGTLFSNSQQSAEAEKNRNFQAGQTGTSIQRRAADLKAAGLNPILAANEGAANASGATANVDDMGNSISSGINSAIAIKQQKKDFEQKDALIANTNAQTGNVVADTANKNAQKDLIMSQAESTAMEAKLKGQQFEEIKATLQSRIKKAIAEGDYSEANQIMQLINMGASSAGSLLNPLKGLIPKRAIEINSKPKPNAWDRYYNKK